MSQKVKRRFDGFEIAAILRSVIIYEHNVTEICFWINRDEKTAYFDLRYGYLDGLEQREMTPDLYKYVNRILTEMSNMDKNLVFKWRFQEEAHIPLLQITFPLENLRQDIVMRIASFAERFEKRIAKEYLHLKRLSLWEWLSAIYEEPRSLILKSFGQDETEIGKSELAWIDAQFRAFKV